MDTNQVNWASCIIPILIIYAATEIRRGWRVLRYKEASLGTSQRMAIGITRLLRGDESADRAYDRLTSNAGEVTYNAWTSFIGGIITLLVCLIWVIIIFRSRNYFGF